MKVDYNPKDSFIGECVGYVTGGVVAGGAKASFITSVLYIGAGGILGAVVGGFVRGLMFDETVTNNKKLIK